jgi:hypothetical protein
MKADAQHQASGAAGRGIPLWQRWFPRAGAIAAGFTTLCFMGMAAALSLASAVGATFLTKDATLKPLLAATIALTLAGSALTYWRHRNPFPLLLTALAGTWVFLFTFVIVGTAHAGTGDTMAGMATSGHAGMPTPHWPLVWAGLALFLGAQLWDVVRVRSCRAPLARRGRIEVPR